MKISEIVNETTTAGCFATVVGGTGPALYRNPSIYDNVGKYIEQPKRKKKPKAELNT